VEVYDSQGKVKGTVELHFWEKGYTIEQCPFPEDEVIGTVYGEWVDTSRIEDEFLVDHWKELDKLRKKGEIHNWSLIWNCNWPILMWFRYPHYHDIPYKGPHIPSSGPWQVPLPPR
jgi:hypothetical protein